jgi:hypothetical protein
MATNFNTRRRNPQNRGRVWRRRRQFELACPTIKTIPHSRSPALSNPLRIEWVRHARSSRTTERRPKLLIKAIGSCDLIWVLIWGGSNVLAQALLEVQNTRSQAEIELFTCKIRVYAIPDQDDAGPWVRLHFPVYPDPVFAVEGDTPTFLSLIQNGLTDLTKPEWGGWGGRYMLTDPSGRSLHYSDAADAVVGKDGKTHVGSQATI